MSILEVSGLCKAYPGFQLSDVSFTLEQGKITGFVGRNGAGKSTVLKSVLGLVTPDRGSVSLFGKNESSADIRRQIGFVSGGFDYYKNKKLHIISRVVSSFYPSWNCGTYMRLLDKFNIDPKKTPSQLSAGMRVKFAIALALSVSPSLLILDEPTSGLDPISREEILEILLDLAKNGTTILFSTHIITDLEKCADNIIYIRKGRILKNCSIEKLLSSYMLLYTDENDIANPLFIGVKASKNGFTALVDTENAHMFDRIQAPTLEDIILHLETEA